MKSLELKDAIIRNKAFQAEAKRKRQKLIEIAQSLPGKTTNGEFLYHEIWKSDDSRFIVGVGKFGKEYYSNSIKWKDGHKGNNPNDMKPTIWVEGKEMSFDGSFDHVFNFFQEVSHKDSRALEILGALMYRNAHVQDHNDELKYQPPREAIEYLNQAFPLYDGISIEAYLHYLEMIAWNEDVKYSTLGYDPNKGPGRLNNMLTYAHIIAVLLGKASFAKLCSSFSRPPVGVSPITYKDAQVAFPELNIR